MIKETRKMFKKFPKSFAEDNRPLYLEVLRKSHKKLYFCISEICSVLDMKGFYKLSECIKTLFITFNDFFETNDHYYQKVMLHFQDLEKKEKQILDFNFKKKYGLIKSELSLDTILEKTAEGTCTSNLKEAMKDLDEKVKVRKEEKKVLAKKEALHDYLKNGLDLMYDGFNFMSDEHKKEEREKRERDMQEKVKKCMLSMHKFDSDYLSSMYEPRVILEVSRRIYGRMMEQSQSTVTSLNNSLQRLSKFKKTEPEALGELEIIAEDMRKAQDLEFSLKTIDPRFVKDSYLEEFINNNENMVIQTFKKYNKKIALKTIDLYNKKHLKTSEDFSCQTDDSNFTYQLIQKVRRLTKEKTKLQNTMINQINSERKKFDNKIEKMAIDLKMQKEKYSEVNSKLVSTMHDLAKSRNDFGDSLVEMVENRKKVNQTIKENDLLIAQRDQLKDNLLEIRKVAQIISLSFTKLFPTGKHLIGPNVKAKTLKDKVIVNRVGMISLGTLSNYVLKSIETTIDKINIKFSIPSSGSLLLYQKPLHVFYLSDFRDFSELKRNLKHYKTRFLGGGSNTNSIDASVDSSARNISRNRSPIESLNATGKIERRKKFKGKNKLKPERRKRRKGDKRYTVDASHFSNVSSDVDKRLTSKFFSTKREVSNNPSTLTINNVNIDVKNGKLSRRERELLKKSKTHNLDKSGRFDGHGEVYGGLSSDGEMDEAEGMIKETEEGEDDGVTFRGNDNSNQKKATIPSLGDQEGSSVTGYSKSSSKFKTIKTKEMTEFQVKNHKIPEVEEKSRSRSPENYTPSPFHLSDKYFYKNRDNIEEPKDGFIPPRNTLGLLFNEIMRVDLSQESQKTLIDLLNFIMTGIEGETEEGNTNDNTNDKRLPRINTGGELSGRSRSPGQDSGKFNFSKLIQGSPKMVYQHQSNNNSNNIDPSKGKLKKLIDFLKNSTGSFKDYNIDNATTPIYRMKLLLAGLRDTLTASKQVRMGTVKKKYIVDREIRGSIEDINRLNKKFKFIKESSSVNWRASSRASSIKEMDNSLTKSKETPMRETPYGVFVAFNPFTSEKKSKKYSLRVAGIKGKKSGKNFRDSSNDVYSYSNYANPKLPRFVIEELQGEFNLLEKKTKEERQELAKNITNAFMEQELGRNRAAGNFKSTKSIDSMPKNGIRKLPIFRNNAKSSRVNQTIRDKQSVEENLVIKKFHIVLLKEMEKFSQVHSGKCGKVCSHLQRFYQRIYALFKNMYNNRGTPLDMNKVTISKMEDVTGQRSTRRRTKHNYLQNIIGGKRI